MIETPAAQDFAAASRGESRWRRLAILLWTTLAIAFCVKTALNPRAHSVFPIFYEAACDWRTGRSLYPESQATFGGFLYSPVFALVGVPLSYLPLSAAGMVFNCASLAFLYTALRGFFRRIVVAWRPSFSEGRFLALCALGTVQGAWSAQSNALILALVLSCVTALADRRFWRAAFLLALAINIKVYPVIIGCLLCVKYGRQFAWRLPAATALIAAAPFVFDASRAMIDYREWIDMLAEREALHIRYTGYRDAWTIWEQTVGTPDFAVYKFAQAGAGLAVLSWCVRNARQGWSNERWLVSTFAWWTMWQLLFGPGTERLTYGILAPVATLAVMETHARGRRFGPTDVAWWLTGLLGTGEVEKALLNAWPGARLYVPCGVVVLAAWSVANEWHDRARTTYEESSEADVISFPTRRASDAPARRVGRRAA
ncbi:MAG: glycosyltransferase family 87 protein [Pirellulales bacterium]